jgi:hypothetical protein
MNWVTKKVQPNVGIMAGDSCATLIFHSGPWLEFTVAINIIKHHLGLTLTASFPPVWVQLRRWVLNMVSPAWQNISQL